eukprot:749469-Hanusia_phi.AAC.2
MLSQTYLPTIIRRECRVQEKVVTRVLFHLYVKLSYKAMSRKRSSNHHRTISSVAVNNEFDLHCKIDEPSANPQARLSVTSYRLFALMDVIPTEVGNVA